MTDFQIERVVYVGTDGFDRPVFKSIDFNRNFFGSTGTLIDSWEPEEEVLKKITEKNLCFFGNSFGCEPMGTPAGNIQIITREEAKKLGKNIRTYG